MGWHVGGMSFGEYMALSRYERWAQQEELTARIVEENARAEIDETPK